MVRKQYFGIKYPFLNADIEKYELDLNTSQKDRVASDLLHLIFTPRGQRLRKPEFGTNLIQFIFEPNLDKEWSDVKKEIQDVVSKWMTGVTLNNIQVAASEDGDEIYVRIDYSVQDGNYIYNNSIAVEI